MPEFDYSDEAINIKSNFYRVDVIAYVEGDDDVIFWNEVFEKVPNFKVEIEPLGSCNAVDAMVEKIDSGEVSAIAARDSDYLGLKGKLSTSPRVLYTHGYSIENSLVSEGGVLAAARTFSRNPTIQPNAVRSWMSHLETSLRELTTLDLATSLTSAPITVLGDNSSRFTVTQAGHKICPRKCQQAVAIATSAVPLKERAEAENLISGTPTLRVLRGHFLMSNFQKFLSGICKSAGKSISASYDSLYSFLVLFFSQRLTVSGSVEESYVTAASKAVATF